MNGGKEMESAGSHLGLLFEQMADIKLTHVPYRGSAPALTDLMGGHVAIYFSSLPPAIGLARDGRVRALAVTGVQRSDVFPDLPTVAEAGVPGYESVLHYGIAAPAGTPRPRSSTSSTRRYATPSTRPTPSSAWPRTAPSRSPARPTNTPPISIARRPNGRRS
jgi:tripartite-type tricarboxylate transporter receptor subunit TctC